MQQLAPEAQHAAAAAVTPRDGVTIRLGWNKELVCWQTVLSCVKIRPAASLNPLVYRAAHGFNIFEQLGS
jgi:hypothetical protein